MTQENPNPGEPTPVPPVPPAVEPVGYETAGGASTYVGPPPDADAKSISAIAHFLNVIWLVPLLIYLLKKDSHPFVKHQSAEALNFALTCFIIHLVCGFTAFLCVPALISFALLIVQIVFGIIAGLKVKEGIPYKYFVSIPIVSQS